MSRAVRPLGLYVLLSLVLFGIPIAAHPTSQIIASDQIDSSQFMWFFAWWPHALLHGLNPLQTHAMLVPGGYNLTWSTAMPLPSLLLAPLTLTAGPVATWNAIQLLSPALSAWTAFLLCRHLCGRLWPSLLGGYLFGFSPYMLTHLTGGPYLALVAMLPLLVLVVVRRLDGSLERRPFMVGLWAVALAQFLISTEVLASGSLFGALALAAAFLLYPELRDRIRSTVVEIVAALALLALTVSPYLAYFFLGPQYPPPNTFFSTDLASLVLPPSVLELSRSTPLRGANTEGYLGVALVALVAIFTWQRRNSRAGRLLAGSFAIALVASLGSHLVARGHLTSIPLPWLAFAKLPVLRYAIPIRFSVFYVLPAAIIAALWLAERPVAGRWALALSAVALILPMPGNAAWHTDASDPAFFRHDTYRAYLKRSDRVLTIPQWGPNQRWQASTGFYFTLVGGYAGAFPRSYTRYATWNTLMTGRLSTDYAAQLRRFIADKRVSAIVIDNRYLGPWQQLFAGLGAAPVHVSGVTLYRLRTA